MATRTTNYNLYLPVVGGDDDQWGSYINTNTTTIDTKLKELNDAIADQDLEELGNVVNTTPTTDQVLQFNGQNWSASTLAIADISGLQTALDAKADDSDLTGITTNPADGSVSYAKLNTALQVQVDRILLTDDDATPTDNQILKYSATDAEWKYADLPGSTVQTLSDVNTAALADDAVMVYNSTAGEFQFESGATLRTTLGVDASGTDNSTPVTLVGSLDYLTLSGQAITLQQVNLTTDVTDTLPVASGGTGSATASDARTALGLQIGVNTQAYDAGLQSISGLTTAADKMLYTTASDTYAVADLTAAGRALLDDADAGAQRTTLGLGTLATQNTITESQISDLQSYITANSTDTLTNKSGAISQWTNDSGYLTAETNDLSAAVTWINVPDANITQSSVTQHQAALSITESQISDLQNYLTAETNDLGSAVTGTLPIANGGTGQTTTSSARIALLPTLGTAGQVLAVNTGTTDVEWVDPVSGSGSGTVTSVAISGTDGIEVDSGSPITTSGTINLGINTTTLSNHLGLGTAAFTASTAYATASQGALADSATQPGDNANTLGSGAAADGYVLTADGAGGAAWEAVSGGSGGTTAYVEHSSTISDSFTVSSGTNRMYVGGTTFSGTITVAGRLAIVAGPANFTGTINVTGTLAIME